jgi:hypothetical protein
VSLSPLAARLAAFVAKAPSSRITLEQMWSAALAADTSLLGADDSRARLREAFDELAQTAVVTLPSPRGSGWECTPLPPLPSWVTRVATARPPVSASKVVWHAKLSWVYRLERERRFTANQLILLRGVQEFLRNDAARLDVPAQERSLELTGDEKLLFTMLNGRLFDCSTEERLSLGLLRSRIVPTPQLPHEVGAGPVTLIVENIATYHSLACELPPDGEVGRVVLGRGNDLGSVLTGLAAVPPCELRYFGDLDVEGLRIARRGAASAAVLGLPELRPAARLYALLVEHGHPQPAKARTIADLPALVAWLPESVRGPVGDMFAAGRRLAQEWVGRELLGTVDLSKV